MSRAKHVAPPEALDLGHLALFVGLAMNDMVMQAMKRAGFESLRQSHAFVIQHLIGGPRAIGELAQLLGVTQQAVSKFIRELESASYVEAIASEDARVHRVQLSARGRACIKASRASRAQLEQNLSSKYGVTELAQAKKLLALVLDEFGGSDAVYRRGVRPPS
jgi:DNA-binding MarR family transcriptional regulator